VEEGIGSGRGKKTEEQRLAAGKSTGPGQRNLGFKTCPCDPHDTSPLAKGSVGAEFPKRYCNGGIINQEPGEKKVRC